MKKKSVLNLLIFALYLVFITTFFVVASYKSESICLEPPCLTFCSENLNSTFFNETTNDYQVTHPLINETTTFKSLLVKVPCENLKTLHLNEWKFSSVSFFAKQNLRKTLEKNFSHQQSEAISVTQDETYSYSTHKYCIVEHENIENAENETTQDFSMMVCDENLKFFEYFHVFCKEKFSMKIQNKQNLFLAALLATIVIFAVILLFYSLINELKNVHGKCMMGFVFSLMIACTLTWRGISIPVFFLNYFLILAFVWILVSIEDVLWILR